MFYRKGDDLTGLLSGLHIDDPDLFIPWDINSKDIESCFQNDFLSQVADDYFVMRNVKLFGTLLCNIGLHFTNKLKKIEIFRDDYTDIYKSFDGFQTVLEKTFGKPIKRKKVPSVIISYEWDICSTVKIHHYIMDRFGLGEYLYIERV
jgi:hypothetical protein